MTRFHTYYRWPNDPELLYVSQGGSARSDLERAGWRRITHLQARNHLGGKEQLEHALSRGREGILRQEFDSTIGIVQHWMTHEEFLASQPQSDRSYP